MLEDEIFFKLVCYIFIVLSDQLTLLFYYTIIYMCICIINNWLNLYIYFTDIFPINFEGAKLVVNKGLSNHFHISHTINMSTVIQSGYR